MAFLYYNNLNVPQPDALMRHTFAGLKVFYDFLRRTKGYMESDAAVKRLAWQSSQAPDDEKGQVQGVWVQLEEPKDRPNEPESTFQAFMDETVNEVYELPDDGADPSDGQRRNSRLVFPESRKIGVLDRESEASKLRLDRRPKDTQLLLRPNTYTLTRQIKALQALQDAPTPLHRPLLRLTEPSAQTAWPDVIPADVADWLVLTNASRPGTHEQRDFVKLALATPDFAFLEGPPGSGKTTAICELILQLARQGLRVLLCASTHVAVDNVLERLMDERNQHRDMVIPVRIGDRRNVSDKARPWQLERFVKTERDRLRRALEQRPNRTASQEALYSTVRHGVDAVERMVLEAANLVCGTTIGILQHPDIKAKGQTTATFDVLIVDEASKTTFQEFLVPAMLAKRWVIVGDPKQLSPYVDDAALAVNVEACLDNPTMRNACVDIFKAGESDPRKRRIAAVASDNDAVWEIYAAQANTLKVEIVDVEIDAEPWSADVVIGAPAELQRRLDELPLDIATIRYAHAAPDALKRRAAAWLRSERRDREEQPEWADEIAWRIARYYEQRFAKQTESTSGLRRSTGERLWNQIAGLMPVAVNGRDEVWGKIDRLRRVALPSILESLRYGFERDSQARGGSALTDGLPESALAQRHVLLSTQHRMHPDIAAFPHEHIYDRKALFTPEYMSDARAWHFTHGPRATWLDVRGKFDARHNANPDEARAVVRELRRFDAWAARNPREDGLPWEAAVLTFYRGQEREVRHHLRQWTGQRTAVRHFDRGHGRNSHLSIELCTVDRFQGHEADVVIISLANTRPTSFLESPNRLNVALTRARYQRIVIGDRKAMEQAKPGVLGLLAADKRWDLGGEQS